MYYLEMSDKRTFTIESAEIKLPEDYQGRFESKTPGAAALKACRRIFKINDELQKSKSKSKGKKSEIRFVLRETTQNSAKKEFHYIGIKRTLDTPIEIRRGDVTITVKYEYKVKACQ